MTRSPGDRDSWEGRVGKRVKQSSTQYRLRKRKEGMIHMTWQTYYVDYSHKYDERWAIDNKGMILLKLTLRYWDGGERVEYDHSQRWDFIAAPSSTGIQSVDWNTALTSRIIENAVVGDWTISIKGNKWTLFQFSPNIRCISANVLFSSKSL